MADGGDDGEGGGGDGTGEGLVVEGGEVFHGAAAAGDEDEVGFIGVGVKPVDTGGYGLRAGGALHGGGIDEEVEAGVAAADDGDDVADDGAGGRGDDADAVGEGWEGALAVGVEEAFGEEAGFELFEGELEGSGTAGFEGFGDELELAAGLVDRDAATDEDGEAVGGAEAKELGLAAEEDDGKLGFAVFEGEVDVAGGGRAAVGDLTFDPEVGVGGFDLLTDVGDEGADGPDAALGGYFDGWRWTLRGGGFEDDGGRRGFDDDGEEAGLEVLCRRGGMFCGAELSLAGSEAGERWRGWRVVFPLRHTA